MDVVAGAVDYGEEATPKKTRRRLLFCYVAVSMNGTAASYNGTTAEKYRWWSTYIINVLRTPNPIKPNEANDSCYLSCSQLLNGRRDGADSHAAVRCRDRWEGIPVMSGETTAAQIHVGLRIIVQS